MNINNYIKIHAHEDFNTFKFSEVDNLILSLIPYLNLTGYVPAFKKDKITLNELVTKLNKNNYKGFFISNTYKMLKNMAHTKRYGDILLYNYMNVVNKEMQFGAITMLLNDSSIYIAYAGTDSSLIGWEEDFKMAYMYPGVSQKYASIYLNKAIGIFPKKVRIGGHSKGGNLAISAALNAKFYHRPKIKEIYNNDGPGFLKEQVESKAYKKISKKIKMFVPTESIIGMILYHENNYEVIKAKSFSIFQHDAFNWICDQNKFIRSKLNKRSKIIAHKLTNRLETLTINERITFIKELFDIFRNNNIKDTKDIKLNDIFKIIKSFKKLDKKTQNLLIEFLIIIFIK